MEIEGDDWGAGGEVVGCFEEHSGEVGTIGVNFGKSRSDIWYCVTSRGLSFLLARTWHGLARPHCSGR